MVDEANTVVAYVIRSWGGAANTLAYAQRRKKRVIRLRGDAAPYPCIIGKVRV